MNFRPPVRYKSFRIQIFREKMLKNRAKCFRRNDSYLGLVKHFPGLFTVIISDRVISFSGISDATTAALGGFDGIRRHRVGSAALDGRSRKRSIGISRDASRDDRPAEFCSRNSRPIRSRSALASFSTCAFYDGESKSSAPGGGRQLKAQSSRRESTPS